MTAPAAVACGECAQWTADPINPIDGVGCCAPRAWPQSRPADFGVRALPLPPYPRAERFCEAFVARDVAAQPERAL